MAEAFLKTADSNGEGGLDDPYHFATELCRRHWGFQAHLTSLGSERDLIFKVETEIGDVFVLKIMDPDFDESDIDLQVRAMDHVCGLNEGLNVPAAVPNQQGEPYFTVSGVTGRQQIVLMTTWQSGDLLVNVPYSETLAYNVGHYLGRLSRALAEFDHSMSARKTRWDFLWAGSVIDRFCDLEHEDAKRYAQPILEGFPTEVLPLLQQQRTQVIHADATPYNVLVSPADEMTVSGVIDFGDIVKTALVSDVAIAACYLIGSGASALNLPAHLIAGYRSVIPFSKDELRLLVPLMAVRHSMTVGITLSQAKAHPENAQAITKNTGTALRCLKTLTGRPLQDWTKTLMQTLEG